ncbi:MAG: substrate-binding periplasmic protein [Rhodospirillaceae bacterium]
MKPIFRFSLRRVRLAALKAALVVLCLLGALHPFQTQAQDLSLAYNSAWPPFSEGRGAEVGGILPGLLNEILETRMGLSVVNEGVPWAQAQAFVRRGSVDVMVTVPTEKRLAYSRASSETVFTLTMRPTVRRGSAAHDQLGSAPVVETLRGLAVCDISGNGWAETFYAANDILYSTASDVPECLERIAADQADVIVQPPEVVVNLLRDMDPTVAETLVTLPGTFAEMEFKLLLSQKSDKGEAFLAEFDATVAAMRADGSYDTVLQGLSGVTTN